jgi:RNA ligase (TIGR02306 family)
MIQRKLASVRRVKAIRPIPDADMIEVVTVDGWDVVSQKAVGHKVGDLVCYFEIDSFLPVREEFEFLRKGCYRSIEGLGEGFRLRTIKLRGQVSQGLIIPLRELDIENKDSLKEYDDLTEVLGVIKFDPPIPTQLQGEVKGNYPGFIPKTDQERIQNVYYQAHLGQMYEASLKLDGSSMTVYGVDPFMSEITTGVCSRNMDYKINAVNESNSFVRIYHRYDLAKKMKEAIEFFGFDMAVQGELMGPGIQGNREKLSEHEFFVYSVFNINTQKYLLPSERRRVVAFLGLKHVPIIEIINLQGFSIDDMLGWVANVTKEPIDGIQWNKIPEGVVFKSVETPENTFKVINNTFLLKCEE